jgi:hypothetical protein
VYTVISILASIGSGGELVSVLVAAVSEDLSLLLSDGASVGNRIYQGR